MTYWILHPIQIGLSVSKWDIATCTLIIVIVSGTKIETISARVSLEDRETAYLAARKRIFSAEDNEMDSLAKDRPRNNPVVARRMIAHALGQRIKRSNEGVHVKDANIGYVEPANEVKSQKVGSSLQSRPKSVGQQSLTLKNGVKIYSNRKVPQSLDLEALSNVTISSTKRSNTNAPNKHNLKDEHIGAAKRMFANALRMHPVKDTVISKCGQTKQTDKS